MRAEIMEVEPVPLAPEEGQFEQYEVVDEDGMPSIPTGVLELSRVTKLTSDARLTTAGPDSKARRPGPYFVATEPNSFGLPSVDTCPGRTAICVQDCYAIKSEKRNATHKKLVRNHEALLVAESVEEKTELLRPLISGYRQEADRLNIPLGERRFRWHWSGDFDSVEYAQAVAIVTAENSDIQFWTYTRSFQPNVNVVPFLAGIHNLDLFLSVDHDNVDDAIPVIEANPEVRIAYLVEYREDAVELQEKLGRTSNDGIGARPCPENMRKGNTEERWIPLVSEEGGACAVCEHCIGVPEHLADRVDVIFVKTGLQHRLQQKLPLDVASIPVEIKSRVRNEKVARPVGELVITQVDDTLFPTEPYTATY